MTAMDLCHGGHVFCGYRYFEGISTPPKPMTKAEVDEANRVYELEQRQRYNERQIRKYKRLKEGTIDSDNQDKYAKKLKVWQNTNKEFVTQHGDVLKRRYENEKLRVPGIDISPKSVDKSAKSGIINAGEGVVLSTYVNSSDNLNAYAKKIVPLTGYEDVVIHGNKTGFELRDLNGKVASEYTPREFAEILREDPNYHGGDIRLISCDTGAEGAIAAEALAKQLKVNVLAPNATVVVYSDGTMEVGENNTGTWVLFEGRKE